ncbi:MAG: hypothetical protein ETSY1_37320 [Candidatus Entotheonella factor]|uniref:Transglutaminase-like domain-containing protein n=1 Tax=Entotheonella factor TaxID=1429438 RepID=W4L7J7_ENTF1|nr:MAG: hypothetical protein ETSY1_37320 [Candidatus Entotheonella factor]
MGTRALWNQHAYHINNIEDDGTIPAEVAPSWLQHGTYRVNQFPDGEAADLTVSNFEALDNGTGQPLSLRVRMGNGGMVTTADVTVAFYQGDPSVSGVLIGTTQVDTLLGQRFVDVELDGVTLVSTDPLYAVVDPDGAVPECSRSNNTVWIPVRANPLGQIAVASDAASYEAASPVSLTATVTNTGSFETDYTVKLHVEDNTGAEVIAFTPLPVVPLAGGASAVLTQAWHTGQTLVGNYLLVGVLLDVDNHELSRSTTALTIHAGADAQAALRLTTDRIGYHTTATVTADALVRNLTSNALLTGTEVFVQLVDASGTNVSTTTLRVGDVAAGGQRQVATQIALEAVPEGTYTLMAELRDAGGTVLAADQFSFDVTENLRLSVQGHVAAAQSEIEAGESQQCTDTLSNLGNLPLRVQPVRQLVVRLDDETLQLNNAPVEIYNWVHDNIEFMPTYGSIQGAQLTLENLKGNAFDIASLTIALMRASGIHARYVMGTVRLPIARVMNWVGGVTDPEVALQILGQGGIPHVALVQGGRVEAVNLEHIWVEVWIDFEPSRGAQHRQGDTWVPMDTAWKQYQYTEGLDVRTNVPFDAEGFFDQVRTSIQVDETAGTMSGFDPSLYAQQLNAYQDQLNSFIEGQNPNATVGDVMGTKRIIPAQRPLLASTLPYGMVVRGGTFSQIPAHLRHQFRFVLYASDFDRTFDIPVFSFSGGLPQLAGQKMTLSFAPQTQADRDTIHNSLPPELTGEDPFDPSTISVALPGYQVRVVAELRVNGEVVATGGRFTLGQVLASTSALYDPRQGWQEFDNTPPVAGEYRVIGVDAAGVTPAKILEIQDQLLASQALLEAQELANFDNDGLAGDLLHSGLMNYFASHDRIDRVVSVLNGMITYRQPSFGSLTLKAQPLFLFGVPILVSFPGVELDITRLVSTIVSETSSPLEQFSYVLQSGVRQFAMEHLIPELLYTDEANPGEAVSAVKALAVASAQGQKIYTITSENADQALPELNIDPNVTDEIRHAAAADKFVIVSENDVSIGGWSGVGYIIVDPATGAGAYQISGGANGAYLVGTLIAMNILVLTVAIASSTSPVPNKGRLALLALALHIATTIHAVNSSNWETFDWKCFASGIFHVAAVVAFFSLFTVPTGINFTIGFIMFSLELVLGIELDILGLVGIFVSSDPFQNCISQ